MRLTLYDRTEPRVVRLLVSGLPSEFASACIIHRVCRRGEINERVTIIRNDGLSEETQPS